MRNLAIIPARSGSKGLPDKNIKDLLGKPLMAYSIEAAIASGCFDEVMVSTDSEHYAEIARQYGANVPFLCSEATSSDTASSWDMVDEVLKNYKSLLGREFDTFCLLQPTSPLRTSEDIKAAYKLYQEKDAIAVLSMTELDHPIEWCGKIDDTLSLDGFHKKLDNTYHDTHHDTRRQDIGKTFRPNGAIYLVSVNEFCKDMFLYREGAYAYIMPINRSVDIDSEDDFKRIEYILEENPEIKALLAKQSEQYHKQNEEVDLENFFLHPSDNVSIELLFLLDKYIDVFCQQYNVGSFRFNSYQAFLLSYIGQIVKLGIHTKTERKLVRYYQKARKIWERAYALQNEFLNRDECEIKLYLLEDLKLIRDVLLQEEEAIGVLNLNFIFQLQKLSSNICTLHKECLEYYFNYKLIADLLSQRINPVEAKKILHDWEITGLKSKLIEDTYKMKVPSFNIKGHYAPNEKKLKQLVYLDTNAIITVEKEKAENINLKWDLILKSKERFDYYYSPSHIEDIQKRDSTVEPRESFLDIINEITNSLEIHRVDEGVRLDYEDAYSCNRRVDEAVSLDITKTIEDIRLRNISDVTLFYPQYANIQHRNEINNKDLFGKDRTLLENALKAVHAPFNIEAVKGIFTKEIPYVELNNIVYHLIYALDVLQYRAEKRREEGKIRSAVHDIEHIIYACYSNFFVTADNRLYHRAKGILAWIAPHVKTLQESEFYKMLDDIPIVIRVAFDTNTYQRVLEPNPKDPKYDVTTKIHQLIVDKKMQGFLSETIFTLEALSGKNRVTFFANYDPKINTNSSTVERDNSLTPIAKFTSGGTTQMPKHGNNPYFNKYWSMAKSLGFKLLRCPRIAGVKDSTFNEEDYTPSPTKWNEVFGACARDIEAHGCGKAIIENIGNRYKQNNNETWFEALKHIITNNVPKEIEEASEAIAEWADADSIAACVAHDIQYFCTEDQGRSAGSNSILHPSNRQWFNQNYNLKIFTMDELLSAIENQGNR